MRLVSKLMAVAILMALVVPAFAADQAPAKRTRPDGLFGAVVKVDGTNLVIKDREGKETTVATDADTKVTIDGKEAKLADLKEGVRVIITPKEGTASEIKAHTSNGRGPRAPKEGAPKEAPAN